MIFKDLLSQLSFSKLAIKKDHSISFVSDLCKRGAWLASRGATSIRAPAQIINLIDADDYLLKKFIADSERLGVNFLQKEQICVVAGHNHLRINFDGVFNSFPDFKETSLLFFSAKTSVNFSDLKKNGLNHALKAKAQIAMAINRVPKSLFVFFNRNSGEYLFYTVDYNYSIAKTAWEMSSAGVADIDIPPRLPLKGESLNAACEVCPLSTICLAPTIPLPTCRSCNNSIISSDGHVYCSLQNNLKLNDSCIKNEGKCTHHIYNPGLLSTWASKKDTTKSGGILYNNLLNNGEFVNGNAPGEYSSYEINSVTGGNAGLIIGDKKVEKIKEIFGASLSD